jgi:hypothetical protein
MALLDHLVKRSPRPSKREPAERRAAKIPTADLPSWAETCISETGRFLTKFEREGDLAALDEALYAAEGAVAVLNEVKRRYT